MKYRNGWGITLAALLALAPLWSGAGSARAADTPGNAPQAGEPKVSAMPGGEPLISPDEMLSVDQLRIGMKGYGRSVFQGTKIEQFNVTVFGVLRKIDFGGDMILIRIDDGYPVTSGSGVSAGMSGSPIFVDGKLIGALAFAWPFAKDPVAGVTPITQMLENYRPGSAPRPAAVAQTGDLRPEGGPLRLDGKLFARASVVADRNLAPRDGGNTLYMAPVATPVLISGMGRTGLEALKRRFSRFSAVVAPGPGKVELPEAERPKIEPGAAVGVQLLGGDVDATAIGTVTYVKGEHVLAFGHPMFGLGSIDMPMTTAFIHGIISSQEVSFKMGAPVETVGHITQDRNWSIGGRTGEKSRTVQAEFIVSDSDRGVKQDYKVEAAVHRDLTSSLLYGSLLNAINSVSPPTAGTTHGTIEVWPKGMPVIRRENVFAVGERRSALEQLFGDPFASMPLAEVLQILEVLENNTFGSVPVERIRVAVDVSEKRRTAAIERAYADRKRVKPGEKVKIGVVIQPANAPKETREFELEIPRNIPGGRLMIGVAGGSTAERVRQYMQISRPPAKTLSQLVAQISDREQNNQLTLEMAQPVVGVAVAGREFPNLPNVMVEVLTGANPAGIRLIRSHTAQVHGVPWVLSGGQMLTLQVEADEKDKSGPALGMGVPGLGGISSILDLFRYGLGGDLSGDFGGELGDGSLDGLEGDLPEGELEEGEGEGFSALRRFGVASRARKPSAPELPNEAKMPSFEELERLLQAGETDTGSASSVGGSATIVRKGLGRAPGVWRVRSAADFQGGKLEGVLVSSRGELALAPPASSLLTSPERFFWAQTTDRAGNVYVGGWLEGSILKIDPSGKLTRFFEGQGEIAISALTSDPEGNLYAAAEPSGTIYRIDAGGTASPLCKLDGHRVWVLKKVGDHLYAGTGSEGRLYRIGMDGKQSVLFTAPDRHILALADDGKGALYCGTYPRGKLFRIRGERAEPVFELPSTAITSLACDTSGNVYAGTSPRAAVVKITPAGDATTLYQSREKHVLCLTVDDGGNVYAGVGGGQARVYRITPDKTVSTLWEPQAAYVLSLTRDGSGSLYATTAGPTQIVRLGAGAAGSGSFTSKVMNAGNLARWGAIRWAGSAEGIQVETRSGNTAYPDSTWSEWSTPYERAAGQPIGSPPGQYLQYRVTLKGKEGAPAPMLRSLDLFYRPRNRAPEVALKAPAAGETLSGTRAARWTGKDPDGDRLTYDLYYAKEGSDVWVKIGTHTPGSTGEDEEEEADEQATARPARHAIPAPRRTAGIPVTRVHRSRPGARPVVARARKPRPVQTAAEIAEAVASAVPDSEAVAEAVAAAEADLDDVLGGGGALTWNTRKVPDGRYRIKIVASDTLTSPDEPLTGEVLSELVQVDNSAPQIRTGIAKRVGLSAPLEVPVKDLVSYVASAEYRIDEGEWMAAAAGDGIFDSTEEVIKIDPSRVKTGKNTLQIRARDAAGNEARVAIPYVQRPVPAARLK